MEKDHEKPFDCDWADLRHRVVGGADGETVEFLGAIPTICEYECQLAIHKGLFYAVMRGAKGDNFWTSADGGVTWKGCGRVSDGLQRQQMLVWRDKVLIGYSAPDEKPSKVRNIARLAAVGNLPRS